MGALYLFTVACYGAAITFKIFDGNTYLQKVKNYPCEHPFITRIKRDSGEKSGKKLSEIEPNVVLTSKDKRLIKKALEIVPLKLQSEHGKNVDEQTCSEFLEWQQKQVHEFNKLSKKSNQEKLKKLYDPDFSVKLGISISKSTATCGSGKPKLCKFYQ